MGASRDERGLVMNMATGSRFAFESLERLARICKAHRWVEELGARTSSHTVIVFWRAGTAAAPARLRGRYGWERVGRYRVPLVGRVLSLRTEPFRLTRKEIDHDAGQRAWRPDEL